MTRIAVLNLQSGIGTTRGYHQYVTGALRYMVPHAERGLAGAARFLTDNDIDLALCAEVMASTRPEGGSQLDTLSRTAEMPHTAYFAVTRGQSAKREGSAILSRLPLTATRAFPLYGGILPRSIGRTVISIDGTPVTVYVAHLALGRTRRQTQLTQLAELLARTEGPVLLGGDFNERDPAAFSLITDAGLRLASSGVSYPSWNPRHALLALFASEHFAIERAETHGGPAFSDHLPLVVDVSLNERAHLIRDPELRYVS